jgi:hypothetical protein
MNHFNHDLFIPNHNFPNFCLKTSWKCCPIFDQNDEIQQLEFEERFSRTVIFKNLNDTSFKSSTNNVTLSKINGSNHFIRDKNNDMNKTINKIKFILLINCPNQIFVNEKTNTQHIQEEIKGDYPITKNGRIYEGKLSAHETIYIHYRLRGGSYGSGSSDEDYGNGDLTDEYDPEWEEVDDPMDITQTLYKGIEKRGGIIPPKAPIIQKSKEEIGKGNPMTHPIIQGKVQKYFSHNYMEEDILKRIGDTEPIKRRDMWC